METPFQTGPVQQSQAGPSVRRRILLPLIVLAAGVISYFQDVKILQGDILNVGDRPVLAISAAIEFRDWNDRVALLETRPLLPSSPAGLKPAQTAHFELSFDRVPRSWNYQMPTVTVNGLKVTNNNK